MRKSWALLVALAFFFTVVPSALAVETGATRVRAAKQNRVYAKAKKHRKAPKARWGNGKRRHRGNF